MASDPFIISRLRNIPLFAQLSTEQLEQVAAVVQVLRYGPGQLVFQQGQPNAGMLYFVSGRGVLTLHHNGMESLVGEILPEQYINENALYTEGLETANLRTAEESLLLFIPRRSVIHLLQKSPEIRTNLRVQQTGDNRAMSRRLFTGQRSDETVLHVYRAHWWAFGRFLWLPILLFIGMIIFALSTIGTTPALGLTLLGLGIVLTGGVGFYLYYEWANDSLIVTDQRIVRIWRNLLKFENTVNEIPLERVLEVNFEIPPADPFAIMFNYGTLSIRTAGEAANFSMMMMPDPKKIQSIIFEQRDKYQTEAKNRSKNIIREEIERALGVDQPINPSQSAKPSDHANTSQQEGLPFLRTKYVTGAGEIVYRRHFTVWLAHVLLSLLVLIGSVILGFLALLPTFPLTGGTGVILAIIMFIGGILWFYAADWDWRNDLLIVGESDLTLIHKRPLWLQNETQRIRLAQVDNVLSDVSGLMNNLLDRGTIEISLVGSNERKKFDMVSAPSEIQAEISRRQAEFKSRQATSEALSQRQAITDYLTVYHETMATPSQATQAMPAQSVPQQPAPQPQQQGPTFYPPQQAAPAPAQPAPQQNPPQVGPQFTRPATNNPTQANVQGQNQRDMMRPPRQRYRPKDLPE